MFGCVKSRINAGVSQRYFQSISGFSVNLWLSLPYSSEYHLFARLLQISCSNLLYSLVIVKIVVEIILTLHVEYCSF